MGDWVAPGTAADVPRPSAGQQDRSPGRGSRALEPEIRPLGPRTPTEVVDAGFGFLRRHPREVVSTAALFVVPLAMIGAFLQRNLFEGESFVEVFTSSDPSTFTGEGTTTGGSLLLQVVALIGPSLGLVFVAAALAKMVATERMGGTVDALAGLRAAGRSAPALLVSWVLVHLLEVLGLFLLVVPGVLALIAFVAVAPVVAVEGAGPIRAMRRSNALTSRRRGGTLGVIAMTVVIVNVVESALSLIPTTAAGIVGFDLGWIILGAGTAAISLITTPFVALATIELYLDLRVRTEALDIELRAIDAFDERPAA